MGNADRTRVKQLEIRNVNETQCNEEHTCEPPEDILEDSNQQCVSR